MTTIKKFEEILSWIEARQLNVLVGELIDDDRFKRNFRLIGQIEGSAGSIMDNIAEGFERGGNKEFIQFLFVAKASCGELGSQLYRAIDRNYITQEEFEILSKKTLGVSGLLQKFINYLQDTNLKGSKFSTKSLNNNKL
ncbi:MAG: four helix bundle protein [Rhizobacter sp.]|nr:four helix bundle protein [Ferruginibacter sp.]